MAAKRYQNDYRLDVRFEKSGKVSQSYTYIGRDWYFAASAETAGKMKKRLFLLVPAGWICFLAALVPVSAAMHTLPVALVFAVTAVPLMLLTDFTLGLRHMQEPLERRQADRLNNRYPAAAFFIILFPGLALAGEAVNVLRRVPLYAGDAVFGLAAALLACAGLCAWRWRHCLEAVEREPRQG